MKTEKSESTDLAVLYKNKLNGERYWGWRNPQFTFIDGEKFMPVVSEDGKRKFNIKADVLVRD